MPPEAHPGTSTTHGVIFNGLGDHSKSNGQPQDDPGANGSQSDAMMGVKQTKTSIYLRTTTPATSTPTLCYKCWEPGHYMTNCTTPSQAFPGFNKQLNDSNIEKAKVLVCTKYWTTVHISKNCTKDPNPLPGINQFGHY
ncbi:hypothetical protein SeMB42_g00731 [Synchytrium endobioticum]|uniref:CCHC-type domain-containing protein n=1 Tax=Synchytrium endobioticum TaxID=286115 RepID=A0A507DQN1_9FUNG|nr:hypothetical protein SeMB42_g00731 [Synchytrium endobioticum]